MAYFVCNPIRKTAFLIGIDLLTKFKIRCSLRLRDLPN